MKASANCYTKTNSPSTLQVVKNYYKGLETGTRELMQLHPDIMYINRNNKCMSSEDFFVTSWYLCGKKYRNRQIIISDNVACVKYELKMPNGTASYCEWFTLEDGMIAIIEVFHGI